VLKGAAASVIDVLFGATKPSEKGRLVSIGRGSIALDPGTVQSPTKLRVQLRVPKSVVAYREPQDVKGLDTIRPGKEVRLTEGASNGHIELELRPI
jgi:hypothetical protein